MRPELSINNPYHISKHRYYELKHFCLQYPEWKRDYQKLLEINSGSVISLTDDNWSDPVGENAALMAELSQKMDKVERTADLVDPVLGKFIFEAVTSGKSYTWLRTVKNIPCGRNVYYEMYRIFFKALSRR